MDYSVMALIRKTSPFIITRILIQAIIAGAAVVIIGIMIGISFLLYKIFGEGIGPFLILIVIVLLSLWGLVKFAERYFLYMVKMGHVAVIAELLDKGTIPEGKGMVAYGKDQVINRFGSTNVAFVADNLVKGAVRQVQRWIMRIGNFFSFIPGSNNIISIINAIMRVSLSYIDEAIMSYVFLRHSGQKAKKDESIWKSASDGIVLYAQNWKGVLKSATISVVFIYAFSIILFLIFVFPLIFVASMIGGGTEGLGFILGFLAIAAAGILTNVAKGMFIDPVVTIIMVRNYQMGIRNLEPAMDLHQKLLGVSSRFRKLNDKAKEEEPINTTPPVMEN